MSDAAPFRPPFVEVGMRVFWYPDGDPNIDPFPAIVTKIGSMHLTLGVIGPNFADLMVLDGVRHVDDPGRVDADNEEGAWEHTPMNKLLIEHVEPALKKQKQDAAKKAQATKEKSGAGA